MVAFTTKVLLASCLVLAIGVYFNYLLQDDPFEYFYLSLQWPPSVCLDVNCSVVLGNFTIHGLWAQTKDDDPYICNKTDFNYSKLEENTSLIAIMNESWPSLVKSKTNIDFWEIEWNRHGSCTFESQRQNDYFNKTCGMWKQAPLLEYFKAKGITPGNKTYTLKNFTEAIQAGLNVKPGPFMCKNIKGKRDIKRLVEVKLCTDKEVTKFEDCTAPEPESLICGKVDDEIPIAFPTYNEDDEVAVLL